MAGRPKTRAKRAAAEKAEVARKAALEKSDSKKSSVKKAPVKKAGLKKAPAKKSPVKKKPVSAAAIKKAPVKKKAPAKKATSKQKPASRAAPVKKAPAKKKAQAKKAPVKKKVPVKKSTVKKKVVERVSRGRPDKRKASGSGAIPSFVTSYTELARFLGVSRQSLNRWTKLDGAPVARSDGRHSISDWKTFMKSNDLSGKSHDLNDLKARDLLAKIEEREFKNAIKRGEYVSVEEVRLSWASCTASALQMLEKALCDELPPILAGLEPVEIRQKNEAQLNEVRRLLHSGEGLTP